MQPHLLLGSLHLRAGLELVPVGPPPPLSLVDLYDVPLPPAADIWSSKLVYSNFVLGSGFYRSGRRVLGFHRGPVKETLTLIICLKSSERAHFIRWGCLSKHEHRTLHFLTVIVRLVSLGVAGMMSSSCIHSCAWPC